MDFIQELYKLDGSYDDLENVECSPIYRDLTYRMKKTLYAGDKTEADSDGIPVPLTDIVTELFQNADQPTISLAQRHVGNITKRAHVTQCSTFLGLLYAKRIKQNDPEFVKRVTSTELFLVSMMLATKFLYDEGEDEEFFNDEWAHVGKLDVKRVHELEREFLNALDWNLFVDPTEFFELVQSIETRIALNQGGRRGWFSYTDLLVLMNTSEWYKVFLDVLQQSVKVICVCSVVYCLCAATMVWSGLLIHHTQVPHTPCYGRLPLPFGLQPSKTTQPNPILDQLVYTFFLRLPVNSDPLGLTRGHTSPWCSSLPPLMAENGDNDVGNNDDDIGSTTSTSSESSMDFDTGYQNDSAHEQQDTDNLNTEKDEDDHHTDETQRVIAKTSAIQDALVIFYHALLSALWEVKEVSQDIPSGISPNLDTDMTNSAVRSNNQMTPPGQKRSCPYRNLRKKSSSQYNEFNRTHASIFAIVADSSLPRQLPSRHDKNLSSKCRWRGATAHGTGESGGDTGFVVSKDTGQSSHGFHMGWQLNKTAQQCKVHAFVNDPPLLPVY